jgi:hypothetical protein
MESICHACGKEAVKHEEELTFPWHGATRQHVLTVVGPIYTCSCGEEWHSNEALEIKQAACFAAE